MNILVTGGAGYIGGTVSSLLATAGHQLLFSTIFATASAMKFLKGVHFIEADIADRPTVESLLRELKPDGVLHFAALIEAGESMKKTRDLLPQQYRLHPFAA